MTPLIQKNHLRKMKIAKLDANVQSLEVSIGLRIWMKMHGINLFGQENSWTHSDNLTLHELEQAYVRPKNSRNFFLLVESHCLVMTKEGGCVNIVLSHNPSPSS